MSGGASRLRALDAALADLAAMAGGGAPPERPGAVRPALSAPAEMEHGDSVAYSAFGADEPASEAEPSSGGEWEIEARDQAASEQDGESASDRSGEDEAWVEVGDGAAGGEREFATRDQPAPESEAGPAPEPRGEDEPPAEGATDLDRTEDDVAGVWAGDGAGVADPRSDEVALVVVSTQPDEVQVGEIVLDPVTLGDSSAGEPTAPPTPPLAAVLRQVERQAAGMAIVRAPRPPFVRGAARPIPPTPTAPRGWRDRIDDLFDRIGGVRLPAGWSWAALGLELLWMALVAVAVVIAVRWFSERPPAPIPPPTTVTVVAEAPAAPVAATPAPAPRTLDWADSLPIPPEIMRGELADILGARPLGSRAAAPARREPAWPGRAAATEGGAGATTTAATASAGAPVSPVLLRRVAGAQISLYDLSLAGAPAAGTLAGRWNVPGACRHRITVTSANGARATGTQSGALGEWVYALAVPDDRCQAAARQAVARTAPAAAVQRALTGATNAVAGTTFTVADLRDVATASVGGVRHAWGVFREPLRSTRILPPPAQAQVAFVAIERDGAWSIVWTARAATAAETLGLAGLYDVLGDGVPEAFFVRGARGGEARLLRVEQDATGGWTSGATYPL